MIGAGHYTPALFLLLKDIAQPVVEAYHYPTLFVAPKNQREYEESPNEDKLKPWRDKSVARQRMIRIDYQLRAVPVTCAIAVTLLIIAGCWAGSSVPVLFFIILFTILGAICFWLDNTD